MIKDIKLIFGILSTVLLIISGISIEITEESDEPKDVRPFWSHHTYRQSNLLDRDSNRFLKRLRRATNLLMFKSEYDEHHKKKTSTEKVIKAVKTVAKGIQEIKGHKHKDKDHHKSGKKYKNSAKVVSVHFEVATISFVLSFTLPKFLNYYLF